jgi:DNA repair protein RecO (recombination protein O)
VKKVFEKVEGIIIRTTDYSETHKIVSIFTKERGKIGLVARGAKKPRSRMAALTQPFIYGSFIYQTGKNLGTLQQGEILYSMREIREDIIKTAYASYLADLTDKILEQNKPESFLWDELLHTLKRIAEDEEPEIITMVYEMKMFEKGGFAPDLKSCANCGNRNNLTHFSVQEAGLLCHLCNHLDLNAVFLNERLIKILQVIRYASIHRIGKINMKDENKKMLRNMLNDYYDKYGSLYLKSRKFLQQLDIFEMDSP